MKKQQINLIKIFSKQLFIPLILFMLLYLVINQQNSKNNNSFFRQYEDKICNSSSSLQLNIQKINPDFKISSDAYYQMTLVQKRIYLQSLFGYNLIQNIENKQEIDRQITQYILIERQLHKKENNKNKLLMMSDKIQSALYQLQNPTNCSNARILVCKLEQVCGFGCAVHHISFCLSIASGIGRTLIFEDEGSGWIYNVTWNELFLRITNCSYLEHVKPFLPIKTYTMPNETNRIIFLDRRQVMKIYKRKLPYAPERAPTKIKKFLLENHSNPSLWFLGQLIKFAVKENEKTKNDTNKLVSRIPFECGPVAGIHVRLTDKKVETKLNNLEDYMNWIDFWFDVMVDSYQFPSNNSLISNCTNKRMLFIATDEPTTILDEAKRKWGNKYEIYHGRQDAQYGDKYNATERISKGALIQLLAEIRILSNCNFVVCTFSSNVCRLVYEIMQTIHGEASENVFSLDYFYTERWKAKRMKATTDYKFNSLYPLTPEEITTKKEDVIVVKGPILKNGFIRGKNRRTGKEGRFPMYLLKEHTIFNNFSAFANIK